MNNYYMKGVQNLGLLKKNLNEIHIVFHFVKTILENPDPN